MPFYDCMLLLKPHVNKESLMDLVARVGKHVYRRNGVLTDIKSFGIVRLGYGIKKLDGRYYQGQLMQMSMMATPNFNKELHYLNKEDRLLRWLLVKHRNTKYGLEFLNEDDVRSELSKFPRSTLFDDENIDEDDDDDDEEDNNDNDNDEDEDHDNQKDHTRRVEDVSLERHQKKRKLKSLISSYEFAPRVAVPSAVAAPAPKPSFGGRNSLTDWTEHETFVLLDAWGDRFLKLGRKSLRSEEWQEVAEKVSRESRTERTDTQCRNRLDTLKKKYKKENMKSGETGGGTNKWVYFKKMDMLMSAAPRQAGLSCGLDSGEYVFMNPRVYLNRPNGLDEMRDSPGNSGSSGGEEDDSDGLPPKRKSCGQDNNEGSSFRLLANSIQKFSEIYEKIENSKRQQMVELEKMRMDFHRDLELQKRQVVERAQAEIAKIRQGDDEETEVSTENVSG